MSAVITSSSPRKRRRRRRSVRTALVVTHRWSALVLGLALLAIVISGVVLLYENEIDRVVHPGLHRSTSSAHPITHSEALAVVRREAPDFKPTDVVDSHGDYVLYGGDEGTKLAWVDPGSGRLLGIDNTGDGVMGFLYNLHICGLSCKGYAGYVGFLEKPAHILGNEDLTVGGLLLAVTGLLMLLLALSGIVVWWPGIKRMARGLRVRRRQGKYAFNYDLHIGHGPAGDRRARLVSVSVPDAKDKTSTYDAFMARGSDPYDHGIYPGNVGVTIDRYSSKATVTYPAPANPSLAGEIEQDWFYGLHAGTFFSGWWRVVWLLFGVTPVVLAVTGVVTWLIRRAKRRRKRSRVAPLAA